MSSTIRRGLNKGLLCLLVGCAVAGVTAQEQAPLEVQAEQGELDLQNRLATYQGKVVVTQGQIRLSGDHLEIHYDENHKPQKLLLTGTPAHYRGRVREATEENAGKADEAQAQQVEYQVDKGLLVLEGEARVWQPQFIVESKRIEYDTRLEKIRTHSGQWILPEPPETLEQ